MKTWQRHFLSLLILLGFVFLACSVYWSDRFPYTHDGENHLIRFVNYLAAIREGQWPPRFAPYVFSGYGFPVFVFNYPLANLMALPLLLLKLHPETVFRFEVALALFLGAWGTLAFFKQSEWKQGAWFATLLYLFSSYLANLLFFRGSIGEIWSYGLAPVGLYVITRALREKTKKWWWFLFALLVAAMLLSHNLFGLMFALVWLVITVIGGRQTFTWNMVMAWVLGIGLSIWFWLPALGELSQTVLQHDNLATQASLNLLSISQILFSPLKFGFSRSGPLDSLGFGLGSVFVFLLIILLSVSGQAIWSLLRKKQEVTQENAYLPLIAGLGVFITIWLSSTWSQGVWQAFPALSILQFPWRLLLPTTFLLVLFGGWFYSQTSKMWRVMLIVLLFIQMVSVISLKPADRFTHETAYYLVNASSTLTRNENRPATFQVAILPNWEPRPQIATGEGIIKETILWTGSRREYQVEALSDVVVVEPTVYFSGWRITADEAIIAIDTETQEGLLAFHLKARPGQPYHMSSRTTENTLYRQIGDGVSLLSLMGWVVWVMLAWKKQKEFIKK